MGSQCVMACCILHALSFLFTTCIAFTVPNQNCDKYHNRHTWEMLECAIEGSTFRAVTRPKAKTSQGVLMLSSSARSSSISASEDLLPGIYAINGANKAISEIMANLKHSSYFRLFCVDILASCEFMPQELFECYTETCEVYPVDDEMVPETLRGDDYLEHEFELDGWARWDMPSNDYYDLEEFPDAYTGYDGSEVWQFIHKKICFDRYHYNDNHWKADFNKAISGIHSLISVQVTSGIQDKIDAGDEFSDAEIWKDPDVEFQRRLSNDGVEPMAIENLYFAYMLFLSAAAKVKDKLLKECQTEKVDGEIYLSNLKDFFSLSVLYDPTVEVAQKKLYDHALQSSNELWQARMRTRDLLRVMNCVQCNKCRLHGKIAMLGLSAALKIHLGKNGEGCDPNQVARAELAALISTIYKFSKAVDFCLKTMR